MQRHPREQFVNSAKAAIAEAILKASEEHDLTYGELTAILAGELASVAKYQIREERHPDEPDKPGGVT